MGVLCTFHLYQNLYTIRMLARTSNSINIQWVPMWFHCIDTFWIAASEQSPFKYVLGKTNIAYLMKSLRVGQQFQCRCWNHENCCVFTSKGAHLLRCRYWPPSHVVFDPRPPPHILLTCSMFAPVWCTRTSNKLFCPKELRIIVFGARKRMRTKDTQC